MVFDRNGRIRYLLNINKLYWYPDAVSRKMLSNSDSMSRKPSTAWMERQGLGMDGEWRGESLSNLVDRVGKVGVRGDESLQNEIVSRLVIEK